MLPKNHVAAWMQQPSINYPTTKCGGRGGERRGRYNKTIKVQRGGWRSKKLSKSEGGIGGLRTFPTWRRGFEVQEESSK
jgi:hypothetical protein